MVNQEKAEEGDFCSWLTTAFRETECLPFLPPLSMEIAWAISATHKWIERALSRALSPRSRARRSLVRKPLSAQPRDLHSQSLQQQGRTKARWSKQVHPFQLRRAM